MNLLPLQNKRIRAEAIVDHYGNRRLYCFSCGNATAALQDAGANVISISPHDKINSQGYISPMVSDEMFQGVNVTSGSLPLHLMSDIAHQYEIILGDTIKNQDVYVPCGSGETLFALSFFIPVSRLKAVTSTFAPIDLDGTSPLEQWVLSQTEIIYLKGIERIGDVVKQLEDRKGVFIDTRNQGLVYNE